MSVARFDSISLPSRHSSRGARFRIDILFEVYNVGVEPIKLGAELFKTKRVDTNHTN